MDPGGAVSYFARAAAAIFDAGTAVITNALGHYLAA